MKLISYVLRWIGNRFLSLAHRCELLTPSIKEEFKRLEIKDQVSSNWIKARGDKTLRLTYPLNQNSIVFDLGGYEGQWASDIYAKYHCRIHVFEPVKKFADEIKRRFENTPEIEVHEFGLAGKHATMQINLAEDGSSVFKEGAQIETVIMVPAIEFLTNRQISYVDLMKINIEGGEFELLEHMLETGIIENIEYIQVQFHDFAPNAEARMQKIQNELSKTHELTYQFPFLWENWKKR